MMTINTKRSFFGARTTLVLGVADIEVCFIALLILSSNFFFHYTKSTIYAALPFGIRKIQTIRSSLFILKKVS